MRFAASTHRNGVSVPFREGKTGHVRQHMYVRLGSNRYSVKGLCHTDLGITGLQRPEPSQVRSAPMVARQQISVELIVRYCQRGGDVFPGIV